MEEDYLFYGAALDEEWEVNVTLDKEFMLFSKGDEEKLASLVAAFLQGGRQVGAEGDNLQQGAERALRSYEGPAEEFKDFVLQGAKEEALRAGDIGPYIKRAGEEARSLAERVSSNNPFVERQLGKTLALPGTEGGKHLLSCAADGLYLSFPVSPDNLYGSWSALLARPRAGGFPSLSSMKERLEKLLLFRLQNPSLRDYSSSSLFEAAEKTILIHLANSAKAEISFWTEDEMRRSASAIGSRPHTNKKKWIVASQEFYLASGLRDLDLSYRRSVLLASL